METNMTQIMEITKTPYKDKYSIIITRKNKKTHKKVIRVKEISGDNVRLLWGIIKSDTVKHPNTNYKRVVKKLIHEYRIASKEKIKEEFLLIAFNGGVFRQKYYFPFYYYPIKVLEAKKFVVYDKRGGIRVLNKRRNL